MEKKTFSVGFNVTVNLAGTLEIESDTKEKAQTLAKYLIKSCIEKEDCLVELSVDEDDENSKFLTVKEIGHLRDLNIKNIIALN